jgi:hypothetical protein
MLSKRLLSGFGAIAFGLSAAGAVAAPGHGGFHGGGFAGRGYGGGYHFYGRRGATFIGEPLDDVYSDGCIWSGRWHRWVCPSY